MSARISDSWAPCVTSAIGSPVAASQYAIRADSQ